MKCLRLLAVSSTLVVAACGSSVGDAPTTALVFDPAPAASGASASNLVEVQLPDLLPAKTGGFLEGYHFKTTNCCKRYRCAGGEGFCDVEDRVCVQEEGQSDVIESVLTLGVPTSIVPIDLTQFGFTGDTIFLQTVFCSEQPTLTSTAEGWFPTPLDTPRSVSPPEGRASETDQFAELQAYYSSASFFEHVRSTLGDGTFCLAESSMACNADGTARMDGKTPERAFHIATNVLLPEFDLTILGLQLALEGRGKTRSNPLLIEDFMRLDNAAFVPALGESPDLPPEIAPLLGAFNRDFDSNIYFQGNRDFAYDGDVVFHELTHAVVHTFVPDLRSASADRWGSHVEPGAMNEAWSDYFSGTLTGDPVTGEYSFPVEPRDMTSGATCPEAIIGQVHQDSKPWSNALWSVRTLVGDANAPAWDQLVMFALAQAAPEETFGGQVDKLLTAMDADPVLADFRSDAETMFAMHGVQDCERVWPLSDQPLPTMLQPSTGEVGLSNMAPSVMQLAVEVPAGSPGVTLNWQQVPSSFFGFGGSFGVPLSAVTSELGPIEWRYNGVNAAPHDALGNAITFDPNAPGSVTSLEAPTQAGEAASFSYTSPGDMCSTRTVHISMVTQGAGVVMQNVTATPDPIDLSGC